MKDFKEKKAIFLTFQPVISCDGVSKKVFAQKEALINIGIDTRIIYPIYTSQTVFMYKMDDKPFYEVNLRKGKDGYQNFYNKVLKYINSNSISLLYIRYGVNSDDLFIHFLSDCKNMGCKIVLEIATYPYDGEFCSLRIIFRVLKEHYYRNRLKKCVDKIVTYSEYKSIFGIPTINISNAIANIPPINPINQIDHVVNIIGVANLAFWHGFDRVIKGLHTYYSNNPKLKVHFIIVGIGNKRVYQNLKDLVHLYRLENVVMFVGAMDGEDLDDLFYKSHLAIGCLACHRKKMKEVKSLKNVEYAMRGIPFIYSEDNKDFDDKEYILKIPADETDVNIENVCSFVKNNELTPTEIRETVKHLTWNEQMFQIVQEI